MPRYSYTGYDSENRPVHGEVEAASLAQALEKLLEDRLNMLHLSLRGRQPLLLSSRAIKIWNYTVSASQGLVRIRSYQARPGLVLCAVFGAFLAAAYALRWGVLAYGVGTAFLLLSIFGACYSEVWELRDDGATLQRLFCGKRWGAVKRLAAKLSFVGVMRHNPPGKTARDHYSIEIRGAGTAGGDSLNLSVLTLAHLEAFFDVFESALDCPTAYEMRGY